MGRKFFFLIMLLCFSMNSWATSSESRDDASKLTLYLYSAPWPLEWDTPGELVRSTLRNSLFGSLDAKNSMGFVPSSSQFSEDELLSILDILEWEENRDNDHKLAFTNGASHPHTIGHINIGVSCASGESFYGGTTSLKSNGDYLREILFQGAALETLVLDVDGRFYTKQEIFEMLPRMRDAGHVHELSFLISEHNCHRLLEYVSLFRARGLNHIYGGLDSDPLAGEGAGCAAFGTSFLEVIGLYDDQFDQVWKRTLRIPKKYMNTSSSSAKRGFWSFVLWGYDGAWSKEGANQAYQKIEFWDPELIFEWIEEIHRGQREYTLPYPYHLKVNSKSLILEIDARDAEDRVGPIFLRE